MLKGGQMMSMTPQEYQELCNKASPSSKSLVRIPTAFAVGGLICVIGQLLLAFYGSLGVSEEQAPAWVSITLIFLSALLTGLRVYNIARYAGAGTLVPITGFANAVASPALEFKSEGLVLGLAAKMFVIAGPVIVYGLAASVAYGLLLVLASLL